MIKLLKFASRNLTRSWFRTILTVIGTAVALVAFIMLRTVLWAWNVGAEFAAHDRLATRHKVSFIMPLPRRYVEDIRQVPGVKDVTWANWFGGKLAAKPDEFFFSGAIDAPSYLKVIDEIDLPAEDTARWMADKKGAVVGAVLAKKMGWTVGSHVVLEGTIFPGDWEFVVAGVYKAKRKSLDESQFFFHWDYLNQNIKEDRRDNVGWIMARIDDTGRSADISAAIDRIFDERDTQTATMSERNMQLSFMAGFSALLTGLNLVSIIILGIMLLILGNTIAMGVRERRREYAVLRAIGFEPWHVRFFVIAEAATLGVVSGIVGVGAGYLFVNNVVGRALEENMGAWFPYFRVEPAAAALAFVIALVLAATAALLPSIQAGRVSVTDALRRVG